jgi:hypothetical protein
VRGTEDDGGAAGGHRVRERDAAAAAVARSAETVVMRRDATRCDAMRCEKVLVVLYDDAR